VAFAAFVAFVFHAVHPAVGGERELRRLLFAGQFRRGADP